MGPLVSILIPCYNAERWIGQAIESALTQTQCKKEVIVLDDGSTDRSLDIIQQFHDSIRWETGPNRGGGKARNELLTLARGDWIQYLDADDYLRPGKLARHVEFVREHPECDIVYSPTAWERVECGELICTDEVIPEPHDPWLLLARWRLPQTGGTLWSREALLRVGGWRDDQPCCQEHELYFRLLEAGARFLHCDSCLAVYRDWDNVARVTRKSRTEVDRQRLIIMDRMETCLLRRRELTASRHQAINEMRHAIARKLWRIDRGWAERVEQRIHESDPHFFPGRHLQRPGLYSVVYRLLGFERAQKLVSYKPMLGRNI
jgi:glycosyltransferase involved in cell wall biosynthesis